MTKYSEDMIIKARRKYLEEYYKLKEGNSKFDTVKELCEFFDISKKTLYKWRNRYEESPFIYRDEVTKGYEGNRNG